MLGLGMFTSVKRLLQRRKETVVMHARAEAADHLFLAGVGGKRPQNVLKGGELATDGHGRTMANDELSKRRVYARTKAPGEVARALLSADGFFVATRMGLQLAEVFTLCVLLEGNRAVELPAVVIGRRTVAGAAGTLRQGVTVRALDQQCSGVALLDALGRGQVVDLKTQEGFAARSQTVSRASSMRELWLELELLMAGQPAHLPTEAPVARGEKVRLDFFINDEDQHLSVDVIVRAVMHHADQTACLGVLFDPKSRARAEAFVLRHQKHLTVA